MEIMSPTSGAEETLTSPTEQQANGQVEEGMDAKLMVATASGDVQQLKDLVKQQESQMMVVVMAKQQASSMEKPHPQQGNMDPHLLALASSGSSDELQTLLYGEDGQGLTIRPSDDTEANKSILSGVTAEGDTALHVVAACGQGDNFYTRFREAKHLIEQNSNDNRRRWWRRRWLTRAERHALTTYGDGDNFLKSARIIHGKDSKLLFAQNNNGDTPLHCAAQAGKSKMVACLIELALADEGGEDSMKELLRKENNDKETALHEAVRVGNDTIVSMLMDKDSELASFPAQGRGASPIYLAYILRHHFGDRGIPYVLAEKSKGNLSVSGQNGQNILHAAAHRDPDVTGLLEWFEQHIGQQNKDHITKQRDENGSTPLHFAAASPSSSCWQVLEANPDALYEADHAGFFPIHVAASVGAFWNVNMFVTERPGSAGLRDAKGRTFLHVAVAKNEVRVIRSACRNLSLSWIMNMVDNDGNTALHLAVEARSLEMFCSLSGNPHVKLNLPNRKGDTPLDIAEYKFNKSGIYNPQNSELNIWVTLIQVGARNGVRRKDQYQDEKTVRVKARDVSKETEMLKDSTESLSIGSVLIASVTFGATFAVPGGYIADDHNHGGSPILARRYAFDAFTASNALAFIFSVMATVSLFHSGSPWVNPKIRRKHYTKASYLVSISITCLAAAFALAAYVVLAPVAHKTAVAICVLISFHVLLYSNMEFIVRRLFLLAPLSRRNGLIWAWRYSAFLMVINLLYANWPLFAIFGWAAYANRHH